MRNLALLMLSIATIQLVAGDYSQREALSVCSENTQELLEYVSMLEKENARLNLMLSEQADESR
tara:strand:- start:211 stop:402 length:192 start_codon:yes stop_codon:yes gene_type:complete